MTTEMANIMQQVDVHQQQLAAWLQQNSYNQYGNQQVAALSQQNSYNQWGQKYLDSVESRYKEMLEAKYRADIAELRYEEEKKFRSMPSPTQNDLDKFPALQNAYDEMLLIWKVCNGAK